MKPIFKQWTCMLLTVCILATSSTIAYADDSNGQFSSLSDTIPKTEESDSAAPILDYAEYSEKNSNLPWATKVVPIDIQQALMSADKEKNIQILDNKEALLIYESENDYVDLPVKVPADGLYTFQFNYYVLDGTSTNPEFKLDLAGQSLFKEAERFTLTRLWGNEGTEIPTDSRGNEYRPNKKEIKTWQPYILQDCNGIYNEPFLLGLTTGEQIIRLYVQRGNIGLTDIRLGVPVSLDPYEEYLQKQSENVVETDGNSTIYQGEKAVLTSEPVIFPVTDRSSAQTYPNSPKLLLLNTIGGSNWKFSGEWIQWDIVVPKSGFYKLNFRVRQDIVRGMNSTRRLYIDGEVPFKEADSITFPYKVGWYHHVIGDGEREYQFYLEEGSHTIRLETVPGEVGQTLRNVEKYVLQLSAIYRDIIFITGINPDVNRDYYLEKSIPDLLERMSSLSKAMREEAAAMEQYTASGSMASQLTETARQLDSFVKEPYTIQHRLASIENNISTLGTWLRTLREQPLQIDWFEVYVADQAPSSEGFTFFSNLWFSIQSFFYTFIVDYDSIGEVYNEGEALQVWVPSNASGREQTNIIKRLIDEKFTRQYNINVNLRLVDSSNTIMQATFSGKGPDVALSLSESVPVDWAMRGMLADLSQYDDFNKVIEDFYPSAMVPFEYNGGVYALPESQTYTMFFYRTDIFAQLGIEAPETWEDFYDIIPVLNKNNLYVGMPSEYMANGIAGVGDGIFQMLLFQKGIGYYNEELSGTAFNNEEVLQSFKEWTSFYTQYGFPLSYVFFNRFRTGEMPCGFAEFTTYNQFKTAAPEIDGLWEMVAVPGTRQSDGSINRTSPSTTQGCVVLEKSNLQDKGYQLLKWWVSAETQLAYATNLEALLGVGVRHSVSSKTAFKQMPWSASEAENLSYQWEQTMDIPQIPGGYYVQRSLTNAFRKVVYNWENEREVLNEYTKKIDEEIKRKRTEFGLEG